MNPFLRSPQKILFAYGLWIALGGLLGLAFTHYYHTDLINTLVINIINCLLLGLLTTSAYFVSLNFQLTQQKLSHALILTAGSACLAGVIQVGLLISVEALLASLFDTPLTASPLPGVLTLVFTLGAAGYAFSLILYDALISVNALKGVEQREAAKELWAKSAELKALRAQINPHFLFNSLNSISALTSIDAEKTRAMIIELSQFYRESLTVSDMTEIPLQRELAICQHFIAVESIRYGDKLKLDVDCNPSALDTLVPPLCLQPLLENAIKHGISRLKTASPIQLKIDIRHQKLYILVSNPMPHTATAQEKPEGTSTGLKNLRSRLTLLYGDKALCNWSTTEDRFQVELIFPHLLMQGH